MTDETRPETLTPDGTEAPTDPPAAPGEANGDETYPDDADGTPDAEDAAYDPDGDAAPNPYTGDAPVVQEDFQ